MSLSRLSQKSRFRLLALLVLFPIYKLVTFFIESDYLWAGIMLIISIIYLISLIVIYLQQRKSRFYGENQPSSEISL